jgi:hypothetical protein
MFFRSLIVLFFAAAGVLPAAAQTPPPSNVYVFPLFVDGASGATNFRSTLRVTNTSSLKSMQCQLVQRNTSAPFTGINGDFYTADVFDGGFSPPALTVLTLDQFLPFEILRTGAVSPLASGYAKLTCPGTVQTQLQFSYYGANNVKLGEATIPPATQGESFQFFIDKRDGTRLGYSLANDAATGGQYMMIARDQFNSLVDVGFDFIDQNSQVSKFVDEILDLSPEFVGSIEIIGVPKSQSYVVGLQFTGSVFTTVQPIVRSTALPH